MYKRILLLYGIVPLVACTLLFMWIPVTHALAQTRATAPSMSTPTPDANTRAEEAVTHAEDTLNVVNTFTAVTGVVLAFAGLFGVVAAILGFRTYRDLSEVKENFQKSIKETREEATKSREALVYMIMGDRLMNLHDIEGARELYKKAGSLMPDDAQILYVLGRLYSGFGDYEAAINALEASHPEEATNQAKVLKELGLAYRRRAEALKQEADNDIALKHLKHSLLLNPSDADAYAILGGLYRRRKEFSLAREAYKQAWESNPAWSYPLNNLATLAWYLGETSEAESYFKYAEVAAQARIKKGQAEIFWDYFDLGLAKLAIGELPAAKTVYQKAILATPGKVQFDSVLNNLYLLAQAPDVMPGLDEIIKMLEKARNVI